METDLARREGKKSGVVTLLFRVLLPHILYLACRYLLDLKPGFLVFFFYFFAFYFSILKTLNVISTVSSSF